MNPFDFSISVNHTKKCSTFNGIDIPFKEGSRVLFNKVNPIIAFKSVILNALTIRISSCVDDLIRNKSRVISSDENMIIFERSNGSVHSFNHPGYKAMEEAKYFLNHCNYNRLNRTHYDQIIKALYCINRPSDIDKVTFEDLISCLMEKIMVGN